MWLLNILAFLIATVYFANKTKEKMTEVFPMTACGMILLLYVLAYFRHLSWIDGISIGILGVAFIIFLKGGKQKRKEWCVEVKDAFCHPATLIVLSSAVLVSLLVQGRIALWWDDVNFWATDVKSIFYLDGFAAKYGNVAPEFGDYPPGVQLFKWWFLHFQPAKFHEGLMYAGFYVLNILLLAPLFSYIKMGKNHVVNGIRFVSACICIIVAPSVIETFYLEGACSDLPMGIALGLFLWSVVEEKKHALIFSYVRQALSLALVMICKNTGFQWVIWGMIFWLVYHGVIYKEGKKKMFLSFIGIMSLPWIVEGSWLLSCLLKRRVAKLTGAGIKMAVSGVVPAVDYRMDLVKNFIQGFFIEPIHRQKTISIDLSVFAFIVLMIAAIVFFTKKELISKRERNVLLGVFISQGFISYGIILIMHLTIFVTELQYLEAVVMTASIERYGVPFTMGLLYILWGIWVSKEHSGTKQAYGIVFAFVFLCAQWPGVYDAFVGYRNDIATKQVERDAMVEAEALLFKEKTKEVWKEKGTRVLYLRDGSKNHWVKDTYINYEVSPVGVVYGNVSESLYQPEECRRVIDESHAKYVYADATLLDNSQLFVGMTEEFQYETLYEIVVQAGEIKLYPVS
ncbi:MAG: hypothetical protein IKW30_02685 [Lachnospiraceae bacterium]|nr:hypothetical protein [Lachnospiraceae bacterium]